MEKKSSRARARQSSKQSGRVPGPRLTKRESEVLELLCHGQSDKLAAAALGITYSGIRRHVDSLLKKYAVNSRLQLLAALIECSDFTALVLGR